MPALGVALKLANPAVMPSLGARSGGEGNFASLGATNDSVMPVDGIAATSLPELSLSRSRAVSTARSRSTGHLNLSQPLGSSAAHTRAAVPINNATSRSLRISIHPDHDVRRLDDDRDAALGFDAELVDRFVGDRGRHDLAAADIDADMRGGGALGHFGDGALELVACTDAHIVLSCAEDPREPSGCLMQTGEGTVVPDRRALTARGRPDPSPFRCEREAPSSCRGGRICDNMQIRCA